MTKQEEILKQISDLTQELRKIIEESKQEAKKPTKEERFKEIITGLVTDVRDDTTYFFKDGKIYFELKNYILWCSYDNVWSVLKNEFNMSYNDIQNFINIRMDFHYKMKGVTPSDCPWTDRPRDGFSLQNERSNTI